MSSLPVLVVEHEAQCPPALMGDWLVAAGCPLDVRRPYLGDDLPDHLDEHRGMVVLGGSMDAYADERHPWLTDVKQLVRGAAAGRSPVLGICLGHQLAAVALGGVVGRNPRGQQIGVLDAGWTSAAATDPLLNAVSKARIALQWNSDIVTVCPDGAEVLAQTRAGEVQAARFADTVWGVQSHPEAGVDVVSAWADDDRDSASERGLDIDEFVADVSAAADELRSSWRPLAERFAALTSEGSLTW